MMMVLGLAWLKILFGSLTLVLQGLGGVDCCFIYNAGFSKQDFWCLTVLLCLINAYSNQLSQNLRMYREEYLCSICAKSGAEGWLTWQELQSFAYVAAIGTFQDQALFQRLFLP